MKHFIQNKKFRDVFNILYGSSKKHIDYQVKRYSNLVENFKKKFKSDNFHLFSTPGRTEIGGNHTDHNHGRVIAASIDLDSIACAAKNESSIVTIWSEGYKKPFVIDISDLKAVAKEAGTTDALIRGIAYRLKQLDYTIGGFDAYMTSNVLSGSGLSSSASIEVLIGTIFNGLFNNNKIRPVELAKIGQFAENNYFKKPCGLMDQTACAVGGIITIDFKNNASPVVKKIDFDFIKEHYSLIVVNTGGSHADLTNDYASIPNEMKKVAAFFGKSVCRDIDKKKMMKHIKQIRKYAGDRALLRALHFFNDNELVLKEVAALKKNDFRSFLRYITQSGNSSWKQLQNCYTNSMPEDQGITLALSLTEEYLIRTGEGACRVHGGGFAGTIQCFLPDRNVKNYTKLIEEVFGENAAAVLHIRPVGTVQLWPV